MPSGSAACLRKGRCAVSLWYGVLALTTIMVTPLALPVCAQEKDLLAYWSFDEGEGTIAHDYSGNGLHLTLPGAIWAAGISGHALEFRGKTCLTIGDGFEEFFTFAGDYSVEVWVKQEEKRPQIYISKWTGAGVGSAWWLGFFQGGAQWAEYNERFQVRLKGPDIADNHWHHLVGVRAGKELSLFIDGESVAHGSSPQELVGKNGAPVKIAGFGPGRAASWPFRGMLDEVRIYDRSLMPEEIRERFLSISQGKKSRTVAPITEGLPPRVLVRIAVPRVISAGASTAVRLTLVTNRAFSGDSLALHFQMNDIQGQLIQEWETPVQPDANSRIHSCFVTLPGLAEGRYQLVVRSDSGATTVREIDVRDFEPIIMENVKIKEQRSRQSPFYRGIVSAYAGLHYKSDGSPDISDTIKHLQGLGVNVYTYLIAPRSAQELAALGAFCGEARAAGIEVWVYLVPPSEAPRDRDKPIAERRYPPFDMDYLKWAEAIARVSLDHDNLTLWMIDDFDGNLGFFTRQYPQEIYQTAKRINPRLLFGVCVYHESLADFARAGYLDFVDALLWGYQHNSARYPECGLDATTLPLEIHDYLRTGKIAIPCIYFTPHSSWPEGRPTRAYLEQAMTTAFEQAGIVWVFTTPGPGTMQADVVQNFCKTHQLPKWKPK